ncbi:MAG TPA: 4Fe-4S dicluster domain-containing protein [Bacteroidetes bacterium]|nr:4Fe-4S dicluster domain-containing protein [Bacteroidota bacterium]
MAIERKVKYEKELDHSFPEWVSTVPGGEHIKECIQCGTCSGICPLSIYMDLTPRRIIAMIDGGFKDEVLRSFSVWLCASCYACTVNCPKDIKITDVMYALKRRAIEERIFPDHKFTIPVLAKSFGDLVRKNGRSTESWLVIKLALKTSLLRLFSMAPLGLKLMKTGRMPLKHEKVQNREQIKKIFQALEAEA